MSESVTHDDRQREPETIRFVKANACGNDFLLLEDREVEGRHAALALRLCARSTGIGADGIEYLRRNADGGLRLRLFNSDGTEAELSGNGTRCVAAWLSLREGRDEMVFATHGGVRRCRVLERIGTRFVIESAMGLPRLMPRTLLMDGVGEVAGVMVHVGNPHFVVFTESENFALHGLPWQELGARLSVDARFPHGTNVEFVRVLARDEIAFRIFERGCGPTQSSGTGTCAAAAAAIETRGGSRVLRAFAEGGAQDVRWPAPGEEMMLTGPAEVVCEGDAFVPSVDERDETMPPLRDLA